ncbi:uncharacterized protein LOC122853402 isoform X2 [Aphidius gifuensis]|nr:uncharacterized protein LOC122853402 isoform X2 [Aphidius gifuensis]XP_044009794.1 uncharacterized protein LOC122853402 isoform X2 [Aphidius gifuensis]
MIEDTEKIVQEYLLEPRLTKRDKILEKYHKKLMIKLNSMFHERPHLKEICQQKDNQLVLSCFTKYDFEAVSPTDNDDTKLNDIKCVFRCCGHNLTYLNIQKYPYSEILSLINVNCTNLKELVVKFIEIEDEDFKNVFSHMHKLERLIITLDCGILTLPLTWVSSLKKIAETLKDLHLECESKEEVFLPDKLSLVFPILITLERLHVYGFQLSPSLVKSIGEIESLNVLELFPRDNYSSNYEKTDMTTIGNLKNLETLDVTWNWGITDEFLINLCENSKKLKHLRILGREITNDGISAVKSLSQLEWFSLGVDTPDEENELIIDQSS